MAVPVKTPLVPVTDPLVKVKVAIVSEFAPISRIPPVTLIRLASAIILLARYCSVPALIEVVPV